MHRNIINLTMLVAGLILFGANEKMPDMCQKIKIQGDDFVFEMNELTEALDIDEDAFIKFATNHPQSYVRTIDRILISCDEATLEEIRTYLENLHNDEAE